jgi:hypothetical protein
VTQKPGGNALIGNAPIIHFIPVRVPSASHYLSGFFFHFVVDLPLRILWFAPMHWSKLALLIGPFWSHPLYSIYLPKNNSTKDAVDPIYASWSLLSVHLRLYLTSHHPLTVNLYVVANH